MDSTARLPPQSQVHLPYHRDLSRNGDFLEGGSNAAFADSCDQRFFGWPVRFLCWDIAYIRTALLSQVRARHTTHSSLIGEYRLFRSIPRYLDIESAHMVQLD